MIESNVRQTRMNTVMKMSATWITAMLLLTLGMARADAAETRPNIIFIFADDWGWGDLSCHGSKLYKTPSLDKLASQGTDFYEFTVGNPVCSPSRSAVMTGHYPARHSVHQHFASIEHHVASGMPDWLDPTPVMLPRVLKEAGYVTGHFGKWHLTNSHVSDPPLPAAYGYDEAAIFNGPGEQVNANPNINAPLATDRAINFIRQHKDRPFFINLWVHATHTPHYPTERWMKKFEKLDESHRVYAAVVAEADERIGQVLATLDELKLADSTLVVFSSDNGPEVTGKGKEQGDLSTGAGLGEYYSVGETGGLRGQKRSLYSGGVGVPFIVRWPGHTPAGRVDKTTVITAVDLLPTFCAAAGVYLPQGFEPDGENLLRAFKGQSMDRTRPIYWDWRGASHGENWPRLAIRDGRWKLLMTLDRKRIELYDVVADRQQARDLSAQHPDVTQRLADAALAWRKTLPTDTPSQAISKDRRKLK